MSAWGQMLPLLWCEDASYPASPEVAPEARISGNAVERAGVSGHPTHPALQGARRDGPGAAVGKLQMLCLQFVRSRVG